MKKKIANWGNYPVIESDEQYAANTNDIAKYARSHSGFIPRGNGRCYGDASLGRQTLSTLCFNKMLLFDKSQGIFKCQSGLTLDQILKVIVPAGWFLPVTPGTKYITVGGAVASDVHGKNHHKEGSFSSHIQEMEVILPAGELILCSPSAHSDLFWATCGGMGLTGIVTTITFRLKKIETAYIKQKQVKAKNLDELLALFDQYDHYTYSMAWIDCLSKRKKFGRGILIVGEHATTEELPARKKQKPLMLPAKRQITFPFNLPSWTLNKLTISIFNFLYYSKNTKKEINGIVPYEPFFYPLDAILHWNRGYGKKGFIQYQFVLPLESKNGLIEILQMIGKKGWGSFLAVLKVFGPQDDLISFPMQGYTLALDFPVRKGLFEFLDELDVIVLKYGGRLYMSKDARMKPEVLAAGYKKLPEFVTIVKKYNPDFSIVSMQSTRLNITPQS